MGTIRESVAPEEDFESITVRSDYGRVYYPRCVIRIEAIFVQAVGEERFTGWECVPSEVVWNNNNAREADTARITLSYRDFPIDPRMLSAAHVQVFVVDARYDTSTVPTTPENLRFQGFVDVPESSLGEDDATVVFDCRDYTALYLNRSWRRVADEEGVSKVIDENTVETTERKSRIKIPANVTLRKFIEDIREKIRPPGTEKIESPPTVFDREEVGDGIVAKRVGKTDLTMSDNDTAWDVLTMVCEWFGQLPVWTIDPKIGPVLRIRTPAADSRNVLELKYGRNVQDVTFRRNLQAPEKKGIRLIIWNPRTGKAVDGLFPSAGRAAGEVQTKSNTLGENAKRVDRTRVQSEIKRIQYILEGDFTQQEANELAEVLYNEQAQGRIEGSIETVDMVDTFDGDLLGVSNGDRLIIDLGAETFTGISHLTPEAAAAYLSDPTKPNSFPADIAQVIVEAYRSVQELDIEFFVTEAEHTWNAEDGYRAKISFTDFLLDKTRSV